MEENGALKVATNAREDELAAAAEALQEGERLMISLEAKLATVSDEKKTLEAQLAASKVTLAEKEEERTAASVVTADLEATVSAMAQLVSRSSPTLPQLDSGGSFICGSNSNECNSKRY